MTKKKITFGNLPPRHEPTEREKELQSRLTRQYSLKAIEQMKVWDYEDTDTARVAGLREHEEKRREEAQQLAKKVQKFNDEKRREGKTAQEIIELVKEQFGICRSTYYDYLKMK
jgi:hypothetical protein